MLPLTSTPPAPVAENPPIQLGAGLDFTDPNSALAPYYLRTAHVLAAAVLAALFLVITHVPVWHTDVWGHLGFGRSIVASRQLPIDDPLCSFSEHGMATIHYAWLSQVGLYLVEHLGESLGPTDELGRIAAGAEMLRLFHALVVALRCLLLLMAFRRLGASSAAALLGLMFVVAASLGNIAVLRPQVLGELCFAALLLAAARPTMSRRAMILIPLLMALWANLHASFAVGFMLLGCVALGRAVEIAFDEKTSVRSMLGDVRVRRPALALLLALGLVAVANPSGPFIFRNLFEMSSHPVVRAMDEWQPLKFDGGPGGQWAYGATIVFVALGCLLGRRLPNTTGIFLTAVFASQPLLHQRTFVWWLMVAPWVAMPAWGAAIERLPLTNGIPSFRKTLLAAAVALLAIAWSGPARWLMTGRPAPAERTLADGTPWRISATLRGARGLGDVEIAPLRDLIRKTYPSGRYAGGVFATETLGDYLLWDLPQDVPVFAYSHVHLFSPEHWQRIVAVRHAEDGWEKVLADSHINLVIVEAELNPTLCDSLRRHGEWKVVIDEAGSTAKRDRRSRLFVAARLRPVM